MKIIYEFTFLILVCFKVFTCNKSDVLSEERLMEISSGLFEIRQSVSSTVSTHFLIKVGMTLSHGTTVAILFLSNDSER